MSLLKSLFLIMFILVPANLTVADQPGAVAFKVGERVSFAIKEMNVKAGEATLEFKGPVKIGGKDVELITFTAKGFNFYDEEKIYMDPKTFYPLVVERDINIFGKKEKITEEYQSNAMILKKLTGGKAFEQVFKRKGPLDNIYCFIYRNRKEGAFKMGDKLSINLPTQVLKMTVKDIGTQKIGGKDFKAFHLKSDPAKYEVWFDASKKKIPLRIDGAIGFGNTSMMMTEYKE